MEGWRKMTEHETTRGRDRRSAWTDPHFWVSIFIQALIGLVAATTMVVTTRRDISDLSKEIAELHGQVTTLQALVTITTEQKGKMEALTERVTKLESFQGTQEQAYNFNFTTRLAKVEARTGISTPSEK